MIVSYIQKKTIREERIRQLLSLSNEVNQYTNDGPVKRLLEAHLTSKLQIQQGKSVLVFSSGTSACHAIMLAYQNINKRKMTWAIPAFTFPTPMVAGMKCKIFDIDPKTHTLPVDESLLKNCDGVVVTTLFGTVCNIDEWTHQCRKNNKILIVDNASSPLTTHAGVSVNNLGDVSFGSLHHTKYFGFGEGGFAVVPSEMYDEVKSASNFGFRGHERIPTKNSSNFKMSDVSAAYCLSHIESYDVEKHLKIQKSLVDYASSVGFEIFNYRSTDVLGNLPILCEKTIDINHFRSLGVEANKYYRPLKDLKHSKKLFDRIVNLPLNSGLSDYQVEFMMNVMKELS